MSSFDPQISRELDAVQAAIERQPQVRREELESREAFWRRIVLQNAKRALEREAQAGERRAA